MRFLLDTTTLSDYVKGTPAVLVRLKASPRQDVATSVVTVMEVEFGLRLNPARARKVRPAVDALLRDIRVLPYEVEDATATADVRAALRQTGTPVGPYDAMIAGVAIRHGLILVTSNRREFAQVKGLRIEDWR